MDEQEKQILAEILANSRATKKFAKWQFIITVAFVVIPIAAMVFIIPSVLNSLSSVYGQGGVVENLSNIK